MNRLSNPELLMLCIKGNSTVEDELKGGLLEVVEGSVGARGREER